MITKGKILKPIFTIYITVFKKCEPEKVPRY